MRLIALFKLFKAAMFIVVGLGALQLLKPDVAASAQQLLEGIATRVDVDAIQRLVARVESLSRQQIELSAAGAFLYSCLCLIEGLGLWWEKRWAEYVVVIATLSVVPFELVALIRHLSLTRSSALLVNLAVASYLIHALRQSHAHSEHAPQ